MLIVSSAVSMNSTHLLHATQVRSEKLQMWVGDEPPREAAATDSRPQISPNVERFGGSMPDYAVIRNLPKGCVGEQSPNVAECSETDRQALDLVILMRTLGKSMAEVNQALRGIVHVRQGSQDAPATSVNTVSASSETPTNGRAGWGLAYDLHEQRTEVEATDFSAQGMVRTADGRNLAFDVDLAMQRVLSETTDVSIRAGDAKKVDPLVLNLTQGPASFDGKQTFDLDGDGSQESIARLAAGSAYLALDKNGNGQVDSGRELFGPQSGNGFEELRGYDEDGNGWIDEGDAVFSQLQLWSPAENTNALTGLQRAGIGAIYLDSVGTPFAVKNGNETNAVVARTGLYLKENGEVSTVQHVDLVV